MAKQRIEKMLIILEEEEVRQILAIAQRDDPEEINNYLIKEFIKKIEVLLRRRC